MEYSIYTRISIKINFPCDISRLTGPRLAALGVAPLLYLLFVDRLDLSLGVAVFVSKRAPDLMQLLQQLHPFLLQTRHRQNAS